MIAVPYPPGFIASTEDNCCAAPLSEPEYSHLVEALDNVVMPLLWQATLKLHAYGFKPLHVARHAGLASIVVQREAPEADAWLYFQIHRSYGHREENECVFWMYAIHHPAGTTTGRPGKLTNLEEPGEVEDIVTAFVETCAKAPRSTSLPAVAKHPSGVSPVNSRGLSRNNAVGICCERLRPAPAASGGDFRTVEYCPIHSGPKVAALLAWTGLARSRDDSDCIVTA